MVRVVHPGSPTGAVRAIPSKSHAHRLLIAAAFADGPTRVHCPAVSDDILRTAEGLESLGAGVRRDADGFTVSPDPAPKSAVIHCADSGSTWRFLLPVAAALGVDTRFTLAGRLPLRPMEPLYLVLEAHGASITGNGTGQVRVMGRLRPGTWQAAGDVSSQFITGLMLAAPLTGADCRIVLRGPLASAGYVDITARAMAAFGVHVQRTEDGILVPAGRGYVSPGQATVEGDWSNAAFFLCAAAARGTNLTVDGLAADSPQGDRAIGDILRRFGAQVSAADGALIVRPAALSGIEVDIDPTPDLAPAVALLGLAAAGETRLRGIARLRLKESDRAESITRTLQALGADADLEPDAIVIRGGKPLSGGRLDSHGDHRIVMMAACAAVLCEGPVHIAGAGAVSKSYPHFFDDLQGLGVFSEEAD